MTELSAVVDLVRDLAQELAVNMEHYEDDETKWFPESLQALNKAAVLLREEGVELPKPVTFVLRRRPAELS